MTAEFTPEMQNVPALALAEAQRQRSPILGTPHLFIALTKVDGATAAALRAQGHVPKAVRDGLRMALGQGQARPDTEPQLTSRAAANLQQAQALAADEGAALGYEVVGGGVFGHIRTSAARFGSGDGVSDGSAHHPNLFSSSITHSGNRFIIPRR